MGGHKVQNIAAVTILQTRKMGSRFQISNLKSLQKNYNLLFVRNLLQNLCCLIYILRKKFVVWKTSARPKLQTVCKTMSLFFFDHFPGPDPAVLSAFGPFWHLINDLQFMKFWIRNFETSWRGEVRDWFRIWILQLKKPPATKTLTARVLRSPQNYKIVEYLFLTTESWLLKSDRVIIRYQSIWTTFQNPGIPTPILAPWFEINRVDPLLLHDKKFSVPFFTIWITARRLR